jgi:hypothetical protein
LQIASAAAVSDEPAMVGIQGGWKTAGDSISALLLKPSAENLSIMGEQAQLGFPTHTPIKTPLTTPVRRAVSGSCFFGATIKNDTNATMKLTGVWCNTGSSNVLVTITGASRRSTARRKPSRASPSQVPADR